MSLSNTKNKWEKLGQKDPLWSVLTWDDKQNLRWNQEEFYKTGLIEIDGLMEQIQKLNIKIKPGSALDFGCGTGRLTFPIAKIFDDTVGVDISSSMIDYANQINNNRANFIINESAHLNIFPDNKFDFILSMLTLQHLEVKYAKQYIKEFVRILKPGGLMVFQIPDHPIEIERNLFKRFKYRKSKQG